MKKTAVAPLLVVGLIGCAAAPLSDYEHFKAGKPWMNFAYKAGNPAFAQERDTTNCQVEAVQRIPQQSVVNTTPSYTTDSQTFCNTIGNQTFCNTTGGQTVGGNTYVTDANATLRSKVFYQCMANKNYRYVNLPPCPEGVPLKGDSKGELPQLSRTTCYVVTPDGRKFVSNY